VHQSQYYSVPFFLHSVCFAKSHLPFLFPRSHYLLQLLTMRNHAYCLTDVLQIHFELFNFILRVTSLSTVSLVSPVSRLCVSCHQSLDYVFRILSESVCSSYPDFSFVSVFGQSCPPPVAAPVYTSTPATVNSTINIIRINQIALSAIPLHDVCSCPWLCQFCPGRLQSSLPFSPLLRKHGRRPPPRLNTERKPAACQPGHGVTARERTYLLARGRRIR
jgi:hypothetical protein